MKFIVRLLCGVLVTLMATACVTNPQANSSDGAVVVESADRARVPSDPAMVGNTGRPQFLDSYADW